MVLEAKHRSGEILNSCFRGKEAHAILARNGKKDQTFLYNGFRRGLPGFNPANMPGFSPHEGFSDGQSPPGYRRGARIPELLVGQDWTNAWRVINTYRAMGVPAYLPYNSPFERQHVGISSVPKNLSVALHQGVKSKRVARLKHLLAIAVRPHSGGKRYWPSHDRSVVFTSELTKVVKEFQHDHGLAPDGIVGHMTDVQLHHSAEYWKRHAPIKRPKPRPIKGKPKPKPATRHPGPFFGPDVYSGDGDIDWMKVRRSGHLFAFVKATEGHDYPDPRFTKARVDAIRKAGLLLSVYHFARPQPGRTPEDEADFFVHTARAAGALKKGDLPPVLDIESCKGLGTKQLQSWVKGFLKHVEKLTGVKCIIYTGLWFWEPRLGNPSRFFGGYPLWLAAYVKNPHQFIPKAWHRYTFWQFTDKGRMAGIASACDVSRFDGSLEDLHALTIR